MTHDAELARAFDGQAAQFEKAPLQNDKAALERLLAFAALPPDSVVLDAGCGPGIICEALLSAGHRVVGVDLSTEMLSRARARCERFGESARFVQGSLLTLGQSGFDAAISRFVVHHVIDALAFIRAQAERVRKGGAVIVSDHTAEPDPERALWHQKIERARDKTHTRSLTSAELVDVFVRAGLREVRLVEEEFELDFDEWFDRGTPALPKAQVRALVEAGTARGFSPVRRPDGGLTIGNVRALVRGTR
ncbi:MAG: class I SAM-dependent methyltransferase [Myxococcales bacterium]